MPTRAALLSLARRTAFGRLVPVVEGEELVRLGSRYGGWVVPTRAVRPGVVCYCCGVGEDATFDLALAEQGCTVVAVDPTPRSAEYVRGLAPLPAGFEFVPLGVWSSRTQLRFYEPKDPAHVSHSVVNLQKTDRYLTVEVETITALMQERGHTWLSVLKLDVEGAEHEALKPFLEAGAPADVVCLEFDQPASLRSVLRTTRALQRAGFRLVARERWDCTFSRGSGTQPPPVPQG
jgi:FkbM family methyltransferase